MLTVHQKTGPQQAQNPPYALGQGGSGGLRETGKGQKREAPGFA